MKVPQIILVCVCLTVAVIQLADGAAFIDELQTEETKYGTTTKYCRYNDMKLGLGSRIKDMEACMKCKCTKEGLGCYSMAHGVVVPDDSVCNNVVVGCRNRWVMKDDITQKCPKKLRPNNFSMVGK